MLVSCRATPQLPRRSPRARGSTVPWSSLQTPSPTAEATRRAGTDRGCRRSRSGARAEVVSTPSMRSANARRGSPKGATEGAAGWRPAASPARRRRSTPPAPAAAVILRPRPVRLPVHRIVDGPTADTDGDGVAPLLGRDKEESSRRRCQRDISLSSCSLPIADWRLPIRAIENQFRSRCTATRGCVTGCSSNRQPRQSAIGNK